MNPTGQIAAEARKKPSKSAIEAAELEIGANYLRALKECKAPLGAFVQKAIDSALEDYRNATARG